MRPDFVSAGRTYLRRAHLRRIREGNREGAGRAGKPVADGNGVVKNRAVILNMSIQPEDNRIFRTPGKGVLPLPAVPCSIRMSFRSYQLERLRPVSRKERERSAGKSGQAHRTAASGLSETVPQGYIHESSHKRQAERLSCRHRQAGTGTL